MKPARSRSRHAMEMLLLALGVLMVLTGLLWRFGDAMIAPVLAREQQLVYRTDHQKILAACRQIEAEHLPLGTTGVRTIENDRASKHTLPAAIQELDFEDITIDENGVTIWFGGGFGHWGFFASRADAPLQACPLGGSNWQLVPGLWFWNEGGSFPADPATSPRIFKSTMLAIAGLAVIVFCVRRQLRDDEAARAQPSERGSGAD